MSRTHPRVLLAVLALLLAVPALARAETTVVSERWFVVEMDGQRAGWGVDRELKTARGSTRHDNEIQFKIGRMGQNVELSVKSGSLESPSGKLVELRQIQDFGLMSQKAKYRFRDDHVLVTTEQAGRTTEKKIDLPAGDWLPPSQAAAYVAEQLRAGAEAFSVSTIDVSYGLQVVDLTYRIEERTTIEAMGKTVPAIRWSVSNSLMPSVKTIEYVDDEGDSIRTELDMGGIQLTILMSEKEFALSPFDAPDLMASTLIKPDKPIDMPRTTSRGQYILSVPGADIPDFPSGGAQTVERLAPDRIRVTVDATDFLPATAEEISDPAYLAASSYCDVDDPEITAVLVRATRGHEGASQVERARAIEAFVNGFIDEKSLGVGFATASEVCQTRQGDCSEHATLTCALLRVDGIPARAVSGLVYVDQFVGERQVFGYHMWTQALLEVEGRRHWVDLDAAVYPFDATHIAVVHSSLADDDMINSMVGVAETLGDLRIEVIEVE